MPAARSPSGRICSGRSFTPGEPSGLPSRPSKRPWRCWAIGPCASRKAMQSTGTIANILYVPGDAEFNVRDGFVRWQYQGQPRSLRLRADCEYVLPSGYRVRLEKQPSGTYWRLVGTRSDSTLCHKPCTVSGGGKSEISKSISNAILKGPIFIGDFQRDLDWIEQILKNDISQIYAHPRPGHRAQRPLLSSERSLGSVIKLLTPSPDYKTEYNAETASTFRRSMRQLVCVLKRHYRPEWGENWREHFSVDQVDGAPGHELKLDNQKLVGNYLRVGFGADGSWRIFKLRPDFNPAEKVQVEDDITASVIVPRDTLGHLDPAYTNPSVKLVANCEAMLFQRPDDAIHRGFDKEAESDLSGPDVFLSNFEPLTLEQAQAIAEEVIEFDKYTEPMKNLIRRAIRGPGDGIRGVVGAPEAGGRQAIEESPLSAEAAGSGQRALHVSGATWRHVSTGRFPRGSRSISR